MTTLVAPPVAETFRNDAPKDSDDSINVLFRFVQGKTLCLPLDPDTSIREMKDSLMRHYCQQQWQPTSSWPAALVAFLTMAHVAMNTQDLFFLYQGKPLDDEALLSDHVPHLVNNKKDTFVTLDAHFRLRGGCFMVSLTVLGTICLAVASSFCTCGLSLLVVPVLLPLLFILPLFCL